MADMTPLLNLPDVPRAISTSEQLPMSGWLIDFDADEPIVTNYTDDGMAVLKQAVILRLLCPRYDYVIYSANYGSMISRNVIGKPRDYAVAMLPTAIEDALMPDSRVLGVRVENIRIDHNTLWCDVILDTVFGQAAISDYQIEV